MVGFLQSRVGIEFIQACCIYHREDEVAEFLRAALLVLALEFHLQFLEFLVHLRPHVVTMFPVETHVAHLVLYAISLYKAGQSLGHTREHRLVAVLLLEFYLFPTLQHILFRLGFLVAIDMRMAEDEFVSLLVANVGNVKLALLATENGIEDDMFQHVAQLLASVFPVLLHGGVAEFINFLYCVGSETVKSLFPVPRAFHSQLIKYVKQTPEGLQFFFSCMHFTLIYDAKVHI